MITQRSFCIDSESHDVSFSSHWDKHRAISTVFYQSFCTLEEYPYAGLYPSYGIQCLALTTKGWKLVGTIRDISLNQDAIIQLVNRLNLRQVDPVHFKNVVEDHLPVE